MAANTFRAKLKSIRRRAKFAFEKGMEMSISKDVSYYIRCVNRLRLDPKQVLYESHNGAGVVCNPAAIFRSLLASPDFAQLKHTWVIDSPAEISRLVKEYGQHRNVRFILRTSRAYLKSLATAKYLIQNTSFPSYFAKRDGQVYVNTWHSITVKTIGYDTPSGNFGSRNMVRNLLMTDYLLSPNSFMTEIFRNSFRLQGLFPGKVLEFGHPRNDTTLNASRTDIVRKLRTRGVTIDPERKVILYAPTWRGASVGQVEGGTDELRAFRAYLEAGIDTSEYQVLIKPHQYHFRAMSEAEKTSGSYVPREIDANELLAITDVLISDYSSIFLDFMVTGRPVMFYVPDKSEYEANRGLYFRLEDLPGPVSEDAADIVTWINEIDLVAKKYEDVRTDTLAWACSNDDGAVSRRVVEVVFGGSLDRPGVISDFVTPEKKRLLFYGGGFGGNGVTAALLSLLAHLDKDKYDITVYGVVAASGTRADNFEKLRNVRAMARTGSYAITRWESFGLQYVKRYALNGPLVRILRPEKALQRDFHRCFGNAHFDYLIDYSGYGTLVASTFRQYRDATKIIWQHADLGAELSNSHKRRLAMYRDNPVTKTALMNTYAAFDKVVACGPAVMEVNLRSLGSPKTADKFTYANNVVDAARVRVLSEVDSLVDFDGPRIVARSKVKPDGSTDLTLVPNSAPAPESGEPFVKFVTMGRLSPEKNHENLLRGFGMFAREHPNSRLYIIGSGPLEKRLAELVDSLGLSSIVTLTGALENPFSVIKHCDCFILPSLHEGYGLVVPEVRMLGLPIIISNFEAAPSICVPDGQLLIGFTAEDISAGFEAFLNGSVPRDYQFDVDAVNLEATAQFESLLS